MKISQIYKQYQIMPSLQLHMRRVAAVASMIVENFDQPLDTPNIISACLLHDMGNILKFDLTMFPDFIGEEGVAFWQQVKDAYAKKYGPVVQIATDAIVKEIGVSARTLELVDAIGFGALEIAPVTTDMAKNICEYADLRVRPHGISSLGERWIDLETRYSSRYSSEADQAKRLAAKKMSQEMETELFKHCKISPHQITEAAASDTISNLQYFEVV